MRISLLLLFILTLFLSNCSSTQTQIKPGSGTVLKDGVYIGEELGWPSMKVEVTIQNGRIRNVRLIESNGTQRYTDMMIPEMPKRVMAAGSTNVDSITGATLSVDNFLSAVRNAMVKARRQ
ncbi:FMN-binding protein [candidate division KSB1 bacterium]|nr:FMN-binding protein [candidate division KSB1 bacterium]